MAVASAGMGASAGSEASGDPASLGGAATSAALALVAGSAAGLTLYDMCKAIDRGMTLESVRLVRKSGGKSGEWQRSGEPGEPARRAGRGER